jgi:hypothetical protein
MPAHSVLPEPSSPISDQRLAVASCGCRFRDKKRVNERKKKTAWICWVCEPTQLSTSPDSPLESFSCYISHESLHIKFRRFPIGVNFPHRRKTPRSTTLVPTRRGAPYPTRFYWSDTLPLRSPPPSTRTTSTPISTSLSSRSFPHLSILGGRHGFGLMSSSRILSPTPTHRLVIVIG